MISFFKGLRRSKPDTLLGKIAALARAGLFEEPVFFKFNEEFFGELKTACAPFFFSGKAGVKFF